MLYLIANILITLVNLGLFALSVKLYTEIFKDKAMNRRSERKDAV